MLLDVTIWLPIFVALLLFVVPESVRIIKASVALLVAIIVQAYAFLIYFSTPMKIQYSVMDIVTFHVAQTSDFSELFRVDALAGLIILFISFFSLMIIIYSLVYIKKIEKHYNYFAFLLLTLGASNGAVLSDNLILLLCFWGFLALTLFKLIPGDDEESAAAANKSLIIIGGSDVIMLFGIAIVWKLTGSLSMSGQSIMTDQWLAIVAFLALLTGSFTKAGAFPFHTWIPDFTKNAPASSSAYLPASLDKLLGIYFMARLCNEVFVLNQWLVLAILTIGVTTIIIGVMMALVQHDYKKLLGYHAVSQVGYMVTGLGLGTALGIIGGLFHMINNALYKSGLFLVAGSVKEQTGEDKIEKLGGLSGTMPVTFISALVFALAISGVPPFNGFASKWIIYQAIIDFGKEPGIANNLWMVWLGLAVIGSALTLASFIKFISGIFLGRLHSRAHAIKETSSVMLAPMLIMGVLCIGFGIFATNYVVPYLFTPIMGEIGYIGSWSSGTISLLIIASIILGFLIYALGTVRNFRREDSFIGGEKMQDSNRFEVTGFYNTISKSKPMSGFYHKAEHKWFDVYDLSRRGVLELTHGLKKMHTGILQTYVVWLILGLILMLVFLLIM